MKLPKKIPVMGKDYKLTVDPELADHGETNRDQFTIVLKSDEIEDGPGLHTLLHELGHALLNRTGVTQGLSEGLEETIVDQYASMMTDLFHMTLKVKKRKYTKKTKIK